MRRLAGAGTGEIDAVRAPQPHDLALHVGTGCGVAVLVVDEARPDVDIDRAGPLHPLPRAIVDGEEFRRGALVLDRRGADPDQWDLFLRENLHHVVDALPVDL